MSASSPNGTEDGGRTVRALRRSDASLVLLVALIALVGVLAASAVRLFEETIDHLLHLGFTQFPAWLWSLGLPAWSAFLVYPALLGLIVAGVKALVPKADRHHSVPLVIIARSKRGGRIGPVATLLKTLGSILTLGAGGSLGREGPVVLLGGGIGSAVGQALRLRSDWTNTLVAAGAGAAIATAFHAPITGALFVMEIVLIQFSASSFALVALACVTASEFGRLLEAAPPFPIPAYQINHPWEIALYLVLGLAVTPFARLYIKVLYGSEHLAGRLAWLPGWLKPALGGILFGLAAIILPRTLGGGYETITEALRGELPLALLATLLVAKLITIGITSGSGWPGGVFTPALFLGAMLGGIYGTFAHLLLPGVVTQPGAYAVVGMAAMIAGATHAPLTAMTLIFEVTRDYRVALPAMVACGVAAVFAQRLSPYSVDTVHLPEHGILLPWQIHDLRAIPLGEVMTRQVHTVRSDVRLKDVVEAMQQSRHGGYPVLDEEGRLAGMVTLSDIRAVPLERRLQTPVSSAMSTGLAVLTPDLTLADAALLMARRGVGRIPVVDPHDRTRLVGLVSRSDVLRSYPSRLAEAEPAGETFLER